MTVLTEGPVLLATKLHPPAGRGLVRRPRLVSRLRPTEHRLTVVDAPAGWGKTSLLVDWMDTCAESVRVAWLALDPGDNDPVLFWSYVITALRDRVPEVSEQAMAALRAGPRALRDAALPSLLNELLGADTAVVLVLDDYHTITDRMVHETVALLIERLPRTAHVLVSTRGDPPLPLARLRAAGDLSELRADDLAFTDAEVATLLKDVHGLTLGSSDVHRLARRTEGWPAGLSLAAISLASLPRDAAGAFIDELIGSDRYILDYLCSEVLTRLPDALRDFVLRTSVLRRLCPPLCEELTGRADAAAMLDQAERAGIFVARLGGTGPWYRYHRLFRELLEHELSLVEPAALPELHRKAAVWFAGAGSVSEAIEHLAFAQEPGRAADLVAENWNVEFNAGRLATVEAWLDVLPPAAVRLDPRLCAARAWLLLDRGQLDEVDPWLAAGEAAAAIAEDGAPRLDTRRDLAVLRAVHRFKIGDVGAAASTARRVQELDSGGPSFASTVAHLLLGLTAYWQGRFTAARRPLGEAVRLARHTTNPLAETYALGYLALAAVEAGQLAEAARILPVGEARVVDPAVGEHFVACLPHLARATLLGATGQPQAAATSAARAVQLARRGAGRLEIALALAVQARLAGPDSEATALLDDAAALLRGCPDPARLPSTLAQARRARPGRNAGRVEDEESGLSERERQLLPLLAGTLSQREIGAVLHLSLNTVKTHTRLLFRKLGVSSRGDAVARAREIGLL
ncbi:LuxR C-terminal-related transcriptional regulator [Pseudonocardia halophobica]|uniref:Helix-turn-helix transcriptional regulator n=1 Tax=Pseudonocardia halophobica TaxID=29401 RepID=A0A9W6KZC8_9PSEU|nr:LuxR C-terminal-related transcriptional regulator [Pseudonocardia halophobica]GLL09351.1 helix-turn-helix transcriptional regulator [Pseudonocardia halophobica]